MGISSLSNAISGLTVAQRQIEVISNNVANASTEGFTRKILPQYSQVIGGVGSGVLASTIMRNVDINLSETLWTQVSSVSYNTIQATYLDRVEEFHGPSDSNISIAAEIASLEDTFTLLADNPTDSYLQADVMNQAIDTVEKINDFSDYITTLRNDAQNEVASTVEEVNALLEQIAEINLQIQRETNLGGTVAAASDVRDNAVRELSGLMEISFFIRGDGVMVIQTNEGAELASTTFQELTFDPNPLSAQSVYPDNVAGVYVGDPETEVGAVDITDSNPGGKLGGLLKLRDVTFPKQMAQLDELAHKMALRFDAQGLLLFTDETGSIPMDTAPDLSTNPETPVNYVGFSAVMQVNPNVLADTSLLQTGTSGSADVEAGSNSVIRRVLDYTFGNVSYQTALGEVDLAVSGLVAPNNTLQEYLGVKSTASVTGTRDLNSYANPTAFINATNNAISATSGTFRITIEEADLSLGPVDIDVDLSAVTDGVGDFGDDLVDYINNTIIPTLSAADQTALTDMGVVIGVSSNGQLSITANADITLDASTPTNAMGINNFEILGFVSGVTESEDPYFDIAVGNNEFERITIEPADDETDLLAKLQAVPGLAVQYNANGELELRSGNDFTDPDYGGELTIVSGAFSASGAGANTVVGAGTVPDGVNLVSAIFGSFNAGPPLQDQIPVVDVEYGSEISNSNGSILSFREDYLGQGANVSTGIDGSQSIVDYAQKMINQHSQELLRVNNLIEDDQTFLELLDTQISQESGVNVDEELSNLIVVQTAYAASARVLNVIDELFDDLLASIS